MIPNPTDFDEILDGCLLEVTAGRSSVEDCLSRYPQVAAQLEPLLRSAARVYALPRPPGLAASKRRAIEQQLLSRAVQSKAPAIPRRPIAPARRSLRLRFGLVALVAVLLLVGGAGVVVTASTASLPDDLLYPVKRLAEQVSLATASSSAQALLHVDLAQGRMDEFEALATRDDIRPELMTEASTEIELAMQTAATLPGDQQQPVLTTVIRLADTHAALIASTSARASAATRASLNASAATASAARERALRLADSLPPDTSTTGASSGTGLTTSTSTSTPTGRPGTVTATSTVAAPTGTGTPGPALPVIKPTDKPTHTPRPPHTPPGQVRTPNTPPGQVKTPKPDNDPPGQAKTPKPKK